MISLKVHDSYRKVVAICDSDLIGQRFEEGERQLDIRKNFFEGDSLSESEAVAQIQKLVLDDSTFNIVGKHAVSAAVKAGLVARESIGMIGGVPFSLIF